MSEKQPVVLLAQPLGSRQAHFDAVVSAIGQTSAGKLRVEYCPKGTSSLPQTFNLAWVQALANRGKYDYFAMLHSDVAPSPLWLDVLYDEITRTKATAVSAVVAIKDVKGVTSTAVGLVDDDFDYRRITLTENRKLPQTYGMADVQAANLWPGFDFAQRCLLINTGCWIADMSWPHWYNVHPDGRYEFCYEQKHRIQVWADGSAHAEFAPEDWLVSRYIHRHGGTCMATKLVRTLHWGDQPYPNDQVWGAETDIEIDRYQADREAVRLAAQPAAV